MSDMQYIGLGTLLGLVAVIGFMNFGNVIFLVLGGVAGVLFGWGVG